MGDRSLAQTGGDSPVTDYRVGSQDVLTITSYDQADLSGKFTVEADGTFTFPLIGRVKAGGLTLRALEDSLKTRLKDEGFFRNPQVTVSVETYRSQKIYVIGEVRSPGSYPLSGDMSLVEAIARAGSTLAVGQWRSDHRSRDAWRYRSFGSITRRKYRNRRLARPPEWRGHAEHCAKGRRYDFRSACRKRLRPWSGEEPERVCPAAEEHHSSSSPVARGWCH